MNNKNILLAGGVITTLFVAGCGDANAEGGEDEFSADGTVRITVAMGAGGGSDRGARVMAEAFNESAQGYNVIVENREGSGGAVGWSHVFDQGDDANQFAKAETAIHTVPLQDGVELPWTYADFTPIAMFAEDSRMVVAAADSEYESCADVIDLSQDEQVAAGIAGTYGPDGLTLALMESEGLDVSIVPFGSTGEAVTALLSGQVDIAPVSAAAVIPYIESGDFRALCTFSEERYNDHEVLADVETATEQGLESGVMTMWRGFLAPPDISESAQQFWIEEVQKAVETDVYAEYIESDVLIPTQLYGEDFAEYLDDYDLQVRESFGE